MKKIGVRERHRWKGRINIMLLYALLVNFENDFISETQLKKNNERRNERTLINVVVISHLVVIKSSPLYGRLTLKFMFFFSLCNLTFSTF